MSDFIHKTALSALTGIILFVWISDIFGQMPDFNITDTRDSKVYPIVHIGSQWWMAQNLDIGTMIPSTTDMTNNEIIEKHCIDNNSAYCDTFGGLYMWDEMMQYTVTESAQGVCPDEWHIPSDGDWKRLEGALGMPGSDIESYGYRGTTEGGKLKLTGYDFWVDPNTGATNEVGFNLLPAGGRSPDGTICCNGYWTDFWTSTLYEVNDSFPWYRQVFNDNSQIYRDLGHKPFGTSVRCVKNTPDYYETGELIDDRNGSIYKTVLIGNQWWMADNLNIGERINTLEQQTDNPVIEKYCYYDDDMMCETYGGLYTWDEAMKYTLDNPQGICPDGWHIPSDNEWKKLEMELGMSSTEVQMTGWDRGTYEGIFLQTEGGSGFDALLGGNTNSSGDFNNMDSYGYYWSSDAYNTEYSWGRVFGKDNVHIARNNYYYKVDGFSVRCVKDTYSPMETLIVAPDEVCAGQGVNITAQVSGGTGTYTYSWTSNPAGTYSGVSTITVSPASDTKYYLAVNDGVSIARDTVMVIVNPLPESNITGPSNVCAGEEGTSYSTPASVNYQYNWTANNGNITSANNINQILVNWGTTAETKSLSLVVADNTSGCEVQKQISVEVFPLPSFSISGSTALCAGEAAKIYSTSSNQNYQYDWFTDNGEITTAADINQIQVNWGVIPGTKTLNLVVADKTSGCQAEKQVSVQVKPMPVFDITGPTEVCAGEEAQSYSAENSLNYTYDWQTENGVITTAADKSQTDVNWGTTPGTKTLYLDVTDNSNGCHAQKQINVEVRPSPEKPDMVRKKTSYIFICKDSGQIYQWYHNGTPIPNETKQFYYARDAQYRNGAISVEISTENGCTNTSDPYVFSKKSSVYNEDPEQHQVFLHPNPNFGLITIEIFDDYTGIIDVEIINNLGQIVQRLQMTKLTDIFESELELKQLETGIYFLIFKLGINREIHRIFINRTN